MAKIKLKEALGTYIPTQFMLKCVERNTNKMNVINIQDATTSIARSSNK